MSTRILAALVALFLSSTLAAQGTNVNLISSLDEHVEYADIWGYVAPNGDEYAILGTTDGTAIINVVNPAAPYQTGYIPGPSSLWRDMKTYDQYCYSVTEGGGGVQIISLVNPEAPVLLSTWGAGIWGNTHNIFIDEATGLAYACGTNNGTEIFDLSGDPTAPVHVGTYGVQYVHDLYVRNGRMHLAAINDGYYRIADASTFATLDTVSTPGLFTHNVWVNDAETVAVTTDESSSGAVAFYDISNPNNIQYLSDWTLDPGARVHNAFILGDRMYASWYTAGFACVDISDPANPSLIGSYDTSPNTGQSFSGAWGCYPYLPSGYVLISDIQAGLIILEVEDPQMEIAHTPLGDTTNEFDPYPVTIDVTHLQGGTVVSAQVHYEVGGNETTTQMTDSGGTTWTANIPGQASPTDVHYHVEAFDGSGNEVREPASGEHHFLVGVETSIAFYGFEGAGDNGWTHGGSGQDDWQRGTPTGKSGTSGGVPWADPSSAYTGNNCWGNDLGPSGFNGAYQPNVDNWLQSPPIDCSGETDVYLKFRRWLTVQDEEFDQAKILVNGVEVWRNATANLNLHPGDGAHELDTSWTEVSYDISAIADDNPSVVVRFELTTNESTELGGWNIDDFELTSVTGTPTQNTVTLTGDTQANAGAIVSYDIADAAPLAAWTLYASKRQNGTVIDGHSFDIGPGVKTAATGSTDFNGLASWTGGPVPNRFAGRTLYLEARVDWSGRIYDSAILTLDVQ